MATRDVDPETTIVLAGAGASADAGVPVAYALFDEIVDSLVAARKFASLLKSMARPGVLPHGAFIRFETLLLWVAEIFDDGLGVLAFLDAYHQPGPIHLALVEAECRVITVNFDDLFEQAATAQGRQALTVDAHQPPPTITDPAVFPVWRLHGTRRIHTPEGVFRADQIPQATTSAIAAASPGVMLGEQARKALTDALDGNTLLVVGYSASDDLDVVPALMDVTPSRIVWIDHAGGRVRAVKLPASQGAREVVAHARSRGIEVDVLRGPSARCLAAVGIPVAGPTALVRPVDWRAGVRRWVPMVRAQDPTGLGLAGLLLANMGQHELALEAFSKSEASGLPYGSWTVPRRSYEIGQTHFMKNPSDLAKARRWAKRALRESETFGDPDCAMFARLLLGRVEYILGNAAKAEEILAEMVHDPAVIGDDRGYALLWQGRALVDLGEFTRAEAAVGEADRWFLASGELEGRVDVASTLARIYAQTGRKLEARELLREAGRLATLLGWADRTFSTGIEAARIAYQVGLHQEALADALAIMPIGAGMDDEPIGWHLCARAAAGGGDLEAGLRYLQLTERTIGSITEDHRGEVLADRAVMALALGKRTLAAQALQRLDAMPTSSITLYAAAVGWAAKQEYEVASGRSIAFRHASLLRAKPVTGETLQEVNRTVSLLGGQW